MPCYCTRFAPTPSGQLHFGSLVAALGSYLRAKSQDGIWHVRIEDIDTARCKKAYADDILHTLEVFGFEINTPILVQSKRLEIYEQYLKTLTDKNLTYYCNCSRALIKESGGVYRNFCRNKQISPQGSSIRFKNLAPVLSFTDVIFNEIINNPQNPSFFEDFILKRKDGLFAYNLVCVIDDALSGVNEVVRGCDLLYGTFHQIELIDALSFKRPSYLHLPLVYEANGLKLSKQNHAQPLDKTNPCALLKEALAFLGQPIPLCTSPNQILTEASKNFQICKIPTNR